MKLSFQDKAAVMTEKDTIRHKEAYYSYRIQILLEIKKKKPRKLPLVKYGILPKVDLVQRAVELSKAEKHSLLTFCL